MEEYPQPEVQNRKNDGFKSLQGMQLIIIIKLYVIILSNHN